MSEKPANHPPEPSEISDRKLEYAEIGCGYGPRSINASTDRRLLYVGSKDGSMVAILLKGTEADNSSSDWQSGLRNQVATYDVGHPSGIRHMVEVEVAEGSPKKRNVLIGRDDGSLELVSFEETVNGFLKCTSTSQRKIELNFGAWLKDRPGRITYLKILHGKVENGSVEKFLLISTSKLGLFIANWPEDWSKSEITSERVSGDMLALICAEPILCPDEKLEGAELEGPAWILVNRTHSLGLLHRDGRSWKVNDLSELWMDPPGQITDFSTIKLGPWSATQGEAEQKSYFGLYLTTDIGVFRLLKEHVQTFFKKKRHLNSNATPALGTDRSDTTTEPSSSSAPATSAFWDSLYPIHLPELAGMCQAVVYWAVAKKSAPEAASTQSRDGYLALAAASGIDYLYHRDFENSGQQEFAPRWKCIRVRRNESYTVRSIGLANFEERWPFVFALAGREDSVRIYRMGSTDTPKAPVTIKKQDLSAFYQLAQQQIDQLNEIHLLDRVMSSHTYPLLIACEAQLRQLASESGDGVALTFRRATFLLTSALCGRMSRVVAPELRETAFRILMQWLNKFAISLTESKNSAGQPANFAPAIQHIDDAVRFIYRMCVGAPSYTGRLGPLRPLVAHNYAAALLYDTLTRQRMRRLDAHIYLGRILERCWDLEQSHELTEPTNSSNFRIENGTWQLEPVVNNGSGHDSMLVSWKPTAGGSGHHESLTWSVPINSRCRALEFKHSVLEKIIAGTQSTGTAAPDPLVPSGSEKTNAQTTFTLRDGIIASIQPSPDGMRISWVEKKVSGKQKEVVNLRTRWPTAATNAHAEVLCMDGTSTFAAAGCSDGGIYAGKPGDKQWYAVGFLEAEITAICCLEVYSGEHSTPLTHIRIVAGTRNGVLMAWQVATDPTTGGVPQKESPTLFTDHLRKRIVALLPCSLTRAPSPRAETAMRNSVHHSPASTSKPSPTATEPKNMGMDCIMAVTEVGYIRIFATPARIEDPKSAQARDKDGFHRLHFPGQRLGSVSFPPTSDSSVIVHAARLLEPSQIETPVEWNAWLKEEASESEWTSKAQKIREIQSLVPIGQNRPRLALLVEQSKVFRLEVLSLITVANTSERVEVCRLLETWWDAILQDDFVADEKRGTLPALGFHRLHYLEALQPIVPLLAASLARWIINEKWKDRFDNTGDETFGTQLNAAVPNHLIPVVKLTQLLPPIKAPDGPSHCNLELEKHKVQNFEDCLGAALQEAQVLKDHRLMSEIADALISRLNKSLRSRLIDSPIKDGELGSIQHLYASSLNCLWRYVKLWEQIDRDQADTLQREMLYSVLDSDILHLLSTHTNALKCTCVSTASILEVQIDFVGKYLSSGDLLLVLNALASTCRALLRAARRFMDERNKDIDWRQPPPEAILHEDATRKLMDTFGNMAARILHVVRGRDDCFVHRITRFYALLMCTNPSFTLEIITSMIDADIDRNILRAVVDQVLLLKTIGIELPGQFLDLLELMLNSPDKRYGGLSSYRLYNDAWQKLPGVVSSDVLHECFDWLIYQNEDQPDPNSDTDREAACRPFGNILIDELSFWYLFDAICTKIEELTDKLRQDGQHITLPPWSDERTKLQQLKKTLDAIRNPQPQLAPIVNASDKESREKRADAITEKISKTERYETRVKHWEHSIDFWSRHLDTFDKDVLGGNEPFKGGEHVQPKLVLLSAKLAAWCRAARAAIAAGPKTLEMYSWPHPELYDRALERLERAASDFPSSVAVQKNLVLAMLGHGILENLDGHALELWEIAQTIDPFIVWQWRMTGGFGNRPGKSTTEALAEYVVGRAHKLEAIPKNLRTLHEVLEPPDKSGSKDVSLANLFSNSVFALDPNCNDALITSDEYKLIKLCIEELVQNHRIHRGSQAEQTQVKVSPQVSDNRFHSVTFSFPVAMSEKERLDSLSEGWGELQAPLPPHDAPTRPSHGTGLYLANLAASMCGWKLSAKFVPQSLHLQFELYKVNSAAATMPSSGDKL